MFILVFMTSSTVSHPLYLPSERITQSSQSGPDVYCLISSSCIQRQLHTSDTKSVSFPFMGIAVLMADISHSCIYQLLSYRLYLQEFISDWQWCACGWRSFHAVSEVMPDYVQLLMGLSP